MVCTHLANVYAKLFNWKQVRTFHLMNVRDRISSFPAAETGYVSCGIGFYEIKLENAQDPKQICEDLTKGFEDDAEIVSQLVEYLKLVDATGMAWFPFTPLCYDDRGFPAFGPDDVPILVFNSHAFQQDTISFDGPMVDYAGWTVCNHIHTPSPSWRAGFDINCIIPPDVWQVTQGKWKEMIHKYSPTSACAIQPTLTDAKACSGSDSVNALKKRPAWRSLGVSSPCMTVSLVLAVVLAVAVLAAVVAAIVPDRWPEMGVSMLAELLLWLLLPALLRWLFELPDATKSGLRRLKPALVKSS